MNLLAFTDGASRGNPGDSGIGLIVKSEEGETVLSLNGYIGITTNNIAEYTALLTLLKAMRDIPCSHLRIHSDSELMVRQVNGQYKVKDQGLKKLHTQVAGLLALLPFPVEITHVTRDRNKDADRLANEGIDARKRPSVLINN